MRQRIIKARRKLRKHLRQRGDNSNFHVTPSLAAYWFNELNFALFDGALRQPEAFIVQEIEDDWGWIETDRPCSKKAKFVYTLADEMDDRAHFLAVLAHEMTHQDEQQTYGRMTHGPNFWAHQPKVNALGLDFDKTF